MILLVISALISIAVAKPASHDPMMNEGMFEGDMLNVAPKRDRNAVPYDSMLWPNGVIPYVIQNSIRDDVENYNLLKRGMKDIEDTTCLKFVRKRPTDKDYVTMFYGDGCFAHWGRITGEQQLSLGDGCYFIGTVVHELLHAIGFEHEHNRSDRDNYLDILWNNIEEKWFYAFGKLEKDRLLTPFDFDSVMLYGQTSFAKSFGLNSMRAKNGRFMDEVYNKAGMSPSDIKRINMLYKCGK